MIEYGNHESENLATASSIFCITLIDIYKLGNFSFDKVPINILWFDSLHFSPMIFIFKKIDRIPPENYSIHMF